MLYVFDCDGVLVDSEVIASEVDAEHLTRLGFPITAEEVTIRFAGLTARELGAIVEVELELEPVARRVRADATRPVEHLEHVVDAGNRLELELEKTRLYDLFAPHIYSAVEVGDRQPKPAPNVYLYAIKQFGVSPRETVILEDSVFGVRAAKAAGARVVGFTGGRHSWPGHADKLTEAGAETVIRRFADLPKVAQAFMAWEGLGD